MMSNEHAGLGAGRTGVKVQGGENAFHLREQQLKIMIETCIYKPRSNHKPKICNRYTHVCAHARTQTQDFFQVHKEHCPGQCVGKTVDSYM